MKFWSILTAVSMTLSALMGAEGQTAEPKEEFRIIASPYEREKSDVPSRVFRLNSEEVTMKLQSPSFPDALHELPGVYVQKTAPDRGTPIIRGFTTSRNVLVADGVRVNNPVLREGPNEYWSLLDPFAYSNAEVILGPGSVIYGSDAIGGVVLVSTKALPRGEKDAGLHFLGGDAYFRYGSAQDSFQEHLQFRLGHSDDLAFSFGVTKSEYNDLEMGDSKELPNSDYENWGGFIRMEYDVDANGTFILGYDHFDIDDTNRVHKTPSSVEYHGTSIESGSSNKYRISDFDRRALFGRYLYRDGTGFIKEADFGLSYQYMTDKYHRFNDDDSTKDRKEWQDETWGVNLKLVSDTAIGELTYGFDYYYDEVDSKDLDTPSAVQGVVADDAFYHQFGLYVQNKYGINEDLDIIGGLRYSYVKIDANKVSTVGAIDEDWNAVTGNLHLVKRFSDHINGFIGVSQGFRAPNLSDSTRDGEFASSGTEVPNGDLDPEYFTTLEAGLNVTKQDYNLQLSVFHTDIKDMIVREKRPDATKRNLDGWGNGIELSGEYWLTDQLSIFGNLSYLDTHIRDHIDRNTDNGLRDDHLSKVPPLNGIVGIQWRPNDVLFAEFFTRYAQDQDNLSLADKSDTQRIPPDGTPGYATYNIRIGYQITEALDFGVSLENLSDEYYRVHGSGQNAAGRSIYATLHYNF
ncbi:MAG: TonB-dependent receptor [Lentisphaerales bacterium]|nr:TonB-dependent receptor [Lentisphaerales bacterium]